MDQHFYTIKNSTIQKELKYDVIKVYKHFSEGNWAIWESKLKNKDSLSSRMHAY